MVDPPEMVYRSTGKTKDEIALNACVNIWFGVGSVALLTLVIPASAGVFGAAALGVAGGYALSFLEKRWV